MLIPFLLAAGNHIRAIEYVLAKKAECAAVGSVALSHFLKKHYYLASQLELKESWGPLPPHPILVNKNLSGKSFNNFLKVIFYFDLVILQYFFVPL